MAALRSVHCGSAPASHHGMRSFLYDVQLCLAYLRASPSMFPISSFDESIFVSFVAALGRIVRAPVSRLRG